MSDWQERSYHGFFQSREITTDDTGKRHAHGWQFYVTSFCGDINYCNVLLADKKETVQVPIDDMNRITIRGRKYGNTAKRQTWNH
jgi:hypothetical protein